jgi:hypothetical protein
MFSSLRGLFETNNSKGKKQSGKRGKAWQLDRAATVCTYFKVDANVAWRLSGPAVAFSVTVWPSKNT